MKPQDIEDELFKHDVTRGVEDSLKMKHSVWSEDNAKLLGPIIGRQPIERGQPGEDWRLGWTHLVLCRIKEEPDDEPT